MATISDIIEQFILDQLEQSDFVNLSRNELANFFSCAPSQINYVLSTRFTTPKGYVVQSFRGGGGYIKLTRVDLNKNEYIKELLSTVLVDEVDYSTCVRILANLEDLEIIDDNVFEILKIALSSKSLSMPVRIEGKLRANILKNILINIIKREN